MIKVRSGNNIILGLSDENMRRLKEGQPIKFDLKELALGDGSLMIFNGRTEEEMTNTILDLKNRK